ncbi:hypothetical protein E2542_SST25058 [Spatholobus suberectus]|nr:hypothetical protein E2542_SST25058 [Spatholobus suberectus]
MPRTNMLAGAINQWRTRLWFLVRCCKGLRFLPAGPGNAAIGFATFNLIRKMPKVRGVTVELRFRLRQLGKNNCVEVKPAINLLRWSLQRAPLLVVAAATRIKINESIRLQSAHA